MSGRQEREGGLHVPQPTAREELMGLGTGRGHQDGLSGVPGQRTPQESGEAKGAESAGQNVGENTAARPQGLELPKGVCPPESLGVHIKNA